MDTDSSLRTIHRGLQNFVLNYNLNVRRRNGDGDYWVEERTIVNRFIVLSVMETRDSCQ